MLLIIAPDSNSCAYLLSQVTIQRTTVIGNVTIYTVKYEGYDFMVVVSGYGKVNIARAITLAVQRANIKNILLIGTIGHLDILRPKVFSAIITRNVSQYDVNYTAIGERCGVIPDMNVGVFDANRDMIAKAVLASKAQGTKCHVGKVLSADRFLSDSCLAYCLRKVCRASGVDSDSGAVGQIAYLEKIPFVGIKVISNNAANDARVQHILYENEALLICQKIALSFVRQMM